MPSSSLENPYSVRDNQHVPISKSPWLLNQMGTFDCYYSLVGVLIPENQALWWQSTYNTLPWGHITRGLSALESLSKHSYCSWRWGKQGDNFHPEGLPHPIMLCSTCKREALPPFGKTILSPSLNPVMVSASYAGIELTYLFPLSGQGPAL